jgi:hypothetical protein
MPRLIPRLLVVALLVPVLVLGACGGGDKDADKEAAGSDAACVQRPAASQPPMANPLPPDIPLPNGTYVTAVQGDEVTLAVPKTLRTVVPYLQTEWPRAGYRVARGEAENDEAETDIAKGSYSAHVTMRSDWCDEDWVKVAVRKSPRS